MQQTAGSLPQDLLIQRNWGKAEEICIANISQLLPPSVHNWRTTELHHTFLGGRELPCKTMIVDKKVEKKGKMKKDEHSKCYQPPLLLSIQGHRLYEVKYLSHSKPVSHSTTEEDYESVARCQRYQENLWLP